MTTRRHLRPRPGAGFAVEIAPDGASAISRDPWGTALRLLTRAASER